MRVDTASLLKELGYRFYYEVEEASEPEYAMVKFSDIVPALSKTRIGGELLYKHQFEAFTALLNGENVILVSGTGSGKTEAWILYVLKKATEGVNLKTIVMYPTLALANDQVRRIQEYSSTVGVGFTQVDSVRVRKKAQGALGRRVLIEELGRSSIVVTNPAFLLHDLKKFLLSPSKSFLANFYKSVDLIVVDEIDFYSPRSIALLLALLKIISLTADKKPQVAVLGATISNPEDLGLFLRDITGRNYRIVKGRPFRVENRTYIVLGKNLRDVWLKIRDKSAEILRGKKIPEEAVRAIEDFDVFAEKPYFYIQLFESMGIEVPSITPDYAEILARFVEDDYVTIVFTRSISHAEEVLRELKNRFGENIPAATHHHLVAKEKREEIEEKARKRIIKLLITPRTLSQGIDIGEVARIVHLGLPDDVREYYQREGRKGRRKELGYSETVIIPFGRWDRELLAGGFNALKEWLGLGIEKTIINPDNLYIHLFTGIAKLISPWFKSELAEEEKEALSKAGVLGRGASLDYAKSIYERINFYEYGPPYGIKRYIVKENREIPLEPIGHCDLVERFQPGCIDYGEEAIVTSLERGGSSRRVARVVEKPFREIDFYQDDAFRIALEEYRYVKDTWGEKPNIMRDLLSGRISSEELCVVYVPSNGFGVYRKVPNRCIWTVRSEKPKSMRIGGETIVFYDRRQIYLPTPTGGEYRDFTYGYSFEVDPVENAELMRLALAALMIILRRRLGIAFETIMYDVIKIGEHKYFNLHEPEAAGLIDKLNWHSVKKIVEEYEFTSLDRILLSQIDELAYSTLISIEFRWDIVKQEIMRLLDYIISRRNVSIIVGGKEIRIPKPNRSLKLLSLCVVTEVSGEDSLKPSLLTALGFFDGEEHSSVVEIYPPIPYIKPPESLRQLESLIAEKIDYEDYRVIVDSLDKTLEQLKKANLRTLARTLSNTPGDRVIDIQRLGKPAWMSNLSIRDILSATGIYKESIRVEDVALAVSDILEKGRVYPEKSEIIKTYLSDKCREVYLSYLLLTSSQAVELSKS
ncbi:DEAD/DEAH box helicase [Thermogladius sp. 4427co]|uniref:DEAD/DEAH box helicase n=1 Tax=Thermogladius sp. 4427co TaxID=3450718 RepID=UPI003F7ACEC1